MVGQPLDILAINETKLESADCDGLLNLPGYTLIRRDRDKFGGGVCVYLRHSINFSRMLDFEDENLEMIVLEIQKPNSSPFLFASWYRPPKLPLEYFESFESFLAKADSKYQEVYLLGDLNCNFLCDPLEAHTKHLLDVLINFQFMQVLNEPSRVTPKTKTLIDLVITNSVESLSHSGVYPLSISDHNLIYAVRKIGIPREQPRLIETRNFRHFNESKFKSDLINSTWPLIANFQNVNDAWSAWKEVFIGVVDKHMPCRIVKIRNKPSPWLNSNVKQVMFKRDWLKKTASKSCSPEDWAAYRQQRNLANREIRHAKKCFYKKQIEEASGDQRATWKILNDLMGKQSDSIMVSELKTDSATLTRPEEIADFLNCHFTTMGPRLASEIPSDQINKKPEDYLTKHSASFQFKNISPSKVLKLLNSVKIAKATGLDKISNKILKLAAPVIYKSLTDLFNFSITSGEFPSDWKVAKVCPLFKSGEKCDANNYRPISVLPSTARVFERILFEQIYRHLSNNKLLYSRQSGFRSLHSTVSALLDMMNDWCFNIDRGMVNGVLFLDLKKAFDTVDHKILLKKLEFYGFEGITLHWFQSYLADRQQVCCVNGVVSSTKTISCGVPQGSILGPLLFLIYVNDMPKCLGYGTARLFADDTNLTFTS